MRARSAVATVAADVEQSSTQVLDACRFLYGRVRLPPAPPDTTTTTLLTRARIHFYLCNALASPLLFLWNGAPVTIWHSPRHLNLYARAHASIVYINNIRK